MDIYKVVKKLIGEIDPVGETNEDTKRLENLEETIELIKSLLSDIESVSINRNRQEYSMKEIGITAYNFRISLTKFED